MNFEIQFPNPVKKTYIVSYNILVIGHYTDISLVQFLHVAMKSLDGGYFTWDTKSDYERCVITVFVRNAKIFSQIIRQKVARSPQMRKVT